MEKISTALGEAWGKMSEAQKKKFDDLAERHKKRYNAKKAEWERKYGPVVTAAAGKRKRVEEERPTSAKSGGKFRKNVEGKRVTANSPRALPTTDKAKALFAKKREAMKLPESATDIDTELILSLDGGTVAAALWHALAPSSQREKPFGENEDAKLADILLKKKANKAPYHQRPPGQAGSRLGLARQARERLQGPPVRPQV
jgi:hypothetical protein